MSLPFYVAPEQQMKDRAEFARKGISRGRSVVVLQYRDGIAFVAENPSHTLHKVSEIYDRIGFAAVGRYNEFENLRIAGIQYADLRGYSYDRRDVTGRGLANQYAQQLGTTFSSGVDKPFEVELIVAELGPARSARPATPCGVMTGVPGMAPVMYPRPMSTDASAEFAPMRPASTRAPSVCQPSGGVSVSRRRKRTSSARSSEAISSLWRSCSTCFLSSSFSSRTSTRSR